MVLAQSMHGTVESTLEVFSANHGTFAIFNQSAHSPSTLLGLHVSPAGAEEGLPVRLIGYRLHVTVSIEV